MAWWRSWAAREAARADQADQELHVTFPKPQDNECTNCPVWFVIDPRHDWISGETISVRDIGLMFDGPFFSREEATNYLGRNRHTYTSAAIVYCKSGHASPRYRAAFEKTPGGAHG